MRKFSITLLSVVFIISSSAPAFAVPIGIKTPIPKQAFPGQIVDINIAFPGSSDGLKRPIDAMLVNDVSGSMSSPWGPGGSKIQASRKASNIFVDLSDDQDRIGMITFESSKKDKVKIDWMNGGNKSFLKSRIDAMAPGGGTTFGPSIIEATQDLVSLNSPDRPRFIVFLTDGQGDVNSRTAAQNVASLARQNNVLIFSIAMGAHVNEEVLKEFACYTDWFDPDQFCAPGNPENNPDNPRNYFHTFDEEELEEAFRQIFYSQSEGYWFQVFDSLNTDQTFDDTYPITDFRVTSGCASETPWKDWSQGDTLLGVTSFVTLIKNIRGGARACIKFKAKLKNLPSGLYPVDHELYSLGGGWKPGEVPSINCDPNSNGLEPSDFDACFNAINTSGSRVFDIQVGEIEILGPPEPYLKTTGGVVGSARDLKPKRSLKDTDLYHNQYLSITESLFDDGYVSAKSWLIQGYSRLNIKPFNVNPIYEQMKTKFTKRCGPYNLPEISVPSIEASILPPGGDLEDECRVLIYKNGAAEDVVLGGLDYPVDGKPVVIFVNGKLTLTSDVNIGEGSGLIFITSGGVSISPNVSNLGGIYITDKAFNTVDGYTDCNTNSPSTSLNVWGSVYIIGPEGDPCFTRDGGSSEASPSEWIHYEPKYLKIFAETIGDVKTVYKEQAP